MEKLSFSLLESRHRRWGHTCRIGDGGLKPGSNPPDLQSGAGEVAVPSGFPPRWPPFHRYTMTQTGGFWKRESQYKHTGWEPKRTILTHGAAWSGGRKACPECAREQVHTEMRKSSPGRCPLPVAKANCVAARRGGEQPGGPHAVRRMTNWIRPGVVTSLLGACPTIRFLPIWVT